ncbi:MAG: DUF4156 domain-containing protein [Nitrosomonas sp.]|nr:DUF4156 domain-containing protein [Nitrosomonas sp.]
MKLKYLSICLIILLMPGCASNELRPEAASIKLVGEVVPDILSAKLLPSSKETSPPADCKLLGEVIGRDYYLITSPSLGLTPTSDIEKLIVGAKNDLRNKAAKIGANVVYLQSAYASTGDDVNISGEAYNCP